MKQIIIRNENSVITYLKQDLTWTSVKSEAGQFKRGVAIITISDLKVPMNELSTEII